MKASFDLSGEQLSKFEASCQVVIQRVDKGTKKATIAACEEIMNASKEQVPKDTLTLLSSAFYEVHKRTDVSSYLYEATLGYGGNGDPVNPKTGKAASEYMLAVHEDLSALHIIGKAKFLEDPLREYANSKFAKNIFEYINEALSTGGS